MSGAALQDTALPHGGSAVAAPHSPHLAERAGGCTQGERGLLPSGCWQGDGHRLTDSSIRNQSSLFFCLFLLCQNHNFLCCFPRKQKQLFSPAAGEPGVGPGVIPQAARMGFPSRTSNAQIPSPKFILQQDLKSISDSTHGTAEVQPPLHRSHLPTGLPAVPGATKIPLASPDTNT